MASNETSYPIYSVINGKSVKGAIMSFFFVLLLIWAYDTMTWRGGIMAFIWWVLIIGSALWFILSIATIKHKVYEISCPACNNNVLFPINETGFSCPTCKMRLVISNGEIVSTGHVVVENPDDD